MKEEKKIQFGQRVSKSDEYVFGWKTMDTKDVSGAKPIVVCFGGAGTANHAMANGVSKQVEKLLGIDNGEGDKSPCEIYSMFYPGGISPNGHGDRNYFDAKIEEKEFDKSELSQEDQECVDAIEEFTSNFVNDVLLHYVSKNGKKIDSVEAAKQMRNVNFVTYCYGSYIIALVNLEFRKRLLELGYSTNEAEMIESQICVFQTAPFSKETKTGQTNVSFTSLSDREISTRPTKKYLDQILESGEVEQKAVGQVVKSENNKTIVYVNALVDLISVDQEHFSQFYMEFYEEWKKKRGISDEEIKGDILPVCLAQCLRGALVNSCQNARGGKYIPVSQETFEKPCEKFMEMVNQAGESHEISKVLSEIMQQPVNYGIINLLESAPDGFNNKEKIF